MSENSLFGWKYRVGLMLPSRNVVMEPDCYAWGQTGVSFHSARMRRDANNSGIHDNIKMLDYALEAATLLQQAGVDLIVFGCTSASFVNGVGSDQDLADRIEQLTSIPTFTVSTAVIELLKRRGYKRITILTPYLDELNEHEKTFFEGNGFEVAAIKGMRIGVSSEVPKVTPQQIYHFVKSNTPGDCDAAFISCTNFRAEEARSWLENDMSIPVVTSNGAVFEKILNHFGSKTVE